MIRKNFFAIFIIIIWALISQKMPNCEANQELDNNIKMCQFITERLASQGISENICVIASGTMIEEADGQINQRAVTVARHSSNASSSCINNMLKSIVLSPLRKKKNAARKALEKKHQELMSCVSGLVEKSRINAGLLYLHIAVNHLDQFGKLLINGRPFIKKIIYESNYQIKKEFFIELIERLLMTSANSIVQDIGISTVIDNNWDQERQILENTLDEQHIDEITFNPGALPHWEVLYDLNQETKGKLHFCQWEEQRLKFRMWNYKKQSGENPHYINRIRSFIGPADNGDNTTPREICF